jgi:hypothetical protein
MAKLELMKKRNENKSNTYKVLETLQENEKPFLLQKA